MPLCTHQVAAIAPWMDWAVRAILRSSQRWCPPRADRRGWPFPPFRSSFPFPGSLSRVSLSTPKRAVSRTKWASIGSDLQLLLHIIDVCHKVRRMPSDLTLLLKHLHATEEKRQQASDGVTNTTTGTVALFVERKTKACAENPNTLPDPPSPLEPPSVRRMLPLFCRTVWLSKVEGALPYTPSSRAHRVPLNSVTTTRIPAIPHPRPHTWY